MAMMSTYPTVGPHRAYRRVSVIATTGPKGGPPLPSTDATSPAQRRLRAPHRRRVRGWLGSAPPLLVRRRTGARDRAPDPREGAADLRFVRAARDDDDPVHPGDRAGGPGRVGRPRRSGRRRGRRLPTGSVASGGSASGDLAD